METIVYILMLFVVMSSVLKLSFWRWWQCAIYSSVLALTTVFLFGDWAIEQSKTQIADYLQNSAALNNMALVITLETVATLVFVFKSFESKTSVFLLVPFLLFPVVFYLLTQIIFANPGVSFEQSTWVVALAIWLGTPLLSFAIRWLIPEEEFRTEVLLLLTVFLCVLGLLSTQNRKIINFS